MDPVGPWYASYNRLAGVQATTSGSGSGATGGDLHHHHLAATGSTAPPTTTAQLLPGGFLSPPPVAYDTVFSPLFHHAAGGKPPAHYVTQVTQQRAQALAQAAAGKQRDGEYHQAQAGFFEQGAWQQNSPFGILPHESVATTTSKAAAYENFNAHFVAAQSLNHLASAKNAAVTRAQSPQVTSASTKSASSTSATFYQVPTTFGNSDSTTSKSFPAANTNIQQSCIVTSPSNTPTSKDYHRVPQVRAAFPASPNSSRPPQSKPTPQQPVQTKAQAKIYPELSNQNERGRSVEDSVQSQSSPISFSIMDGSSGRMSYSASSTGKRQFQHTNYRHYQQGNGNLEGEFQRPKSGPEYSGANGPDCNVVVPRRPSPLQAHSQASPLGHVPSPAYPMYNSPMSSISSPQQNNSNQVTPPSPLDVSVPRPNSQSGGNVAYPSVITRALNTDKNFQERYERPNQPTAQPQANNQNQSNCWDERQTQGRKFQSNAYGTTNNDRTQPQQQQQQPQQQTYFESGHQMTLQDLSSCRGDPMSLVKNLQQQQSCQVQQLDVKQESKQPIKRRKSSEKGAAVSNEIAGPTVEYFSRIPPPAHSSGSNQQQQNGTYFDFDRWNLPTPSSKIFTSQTVHQQHQGLMVPHPHTHHPPPPPLPYFPPFHLAPHPSEFPSSVELGPIPSAYGDQPPPHPGPYPHHQQHQHQPPPPEDPQPKVVVPNIEEELNFLSEGDRPQTQNTAIRRPMPAVAAITKPTEKPTGPGAGFMNSYLKFLQGERDSSPPPSARSGRKQSWSSRTPAKTVESGRGVESNGVGHAAPVAPPQPVVPAPVARLSTQGDPQDDPRYFPLPKERKRSSFDSSDDGISSDDDLFNRKVPPLLAKQDQPKVKSRKSKSNRERSEKRKKAKEERKIREERKEKYVDEPLPRRETSKRAAKEKVNIKQLIEKQGEDELEEPAEFADSDSDPVWTPAKNEPEEEVLMEKRKKRGRPPGSTKKKSSKNSVPCQYSETDEYIGGSTQTKKQKAANKQKTASAPTLEDNIAAAVALQGTGGSVHSTKEDDNPFKTGEFVAIKSELNQEWPAIWRVDGKTLLQKYEPFDQNGQMLYRNISTYTSWTPESKKQYVNVPVKYKLQGHLETVVEFLKHEMTVIDQEFFNRAIKQSEIYQDNFEVYIQTLISQALDSNFLMEIFQEKDEYFLSNVKTIDEITEGKQMKLLSLLRWPERVQVAVTTWPCFNVLRELSTPDVHRKQCDTCRKNGVAVRVLMYGQPYNSTTLEGCPPNPQAVNEKNFMMCRICASRVELLNKISHQKYLMYIECAKRVAEKRSAEAQKDTTCILNELLADEEWLNSIFLEVRHAWAEVDSLEYSYQLKNNKVQ